MIGLHDLGGTGGGPIDKSRQEVEGFEAPENIKVRVHDSTADIRYMVLPMRPEGTEGMSEEELAGLVTRDSLVGVAVPTSK